MGQICIYKGFQIYKSIYSRGLFIFAKGDDIFGKLIDEIEYDIVSNCSQKVLVAKAKKFIDAHIQKKKKVVE